jgi:PAB-dependent poly(A)-specific ribonuclease subunit 3
LLLFLSVGLTTTTTNRQALERQLFNNAAAAAAAAGSGAAPATVSAASQVLNDFKVGFQQPRTLQSFFVSENLRDELLSRVEALYAVPDAADPRRSSLPASVRTFHSFMPLDELDGAAGKSKMTMFGHASHVYKCVSSVDGQAYALRRIEGFRLQSELALAAVDVWKRVRHPNVAALHHAFVSKEFDGQNSLCFVYDYFPGAVTLAQRYLPTPHSPAPPQALPEPVLWSFILQMVSALKAIHSAGLVCRVLHPSKVVITGRNRIRLGSATGILDVISFDGGLNLAHRQYEDLVSLGKFILVMACQNAGAVQTAAKSVEQLAAAYGPDMKSLVLYLLTAKPVLPTIDDVVALLAGRFLGEADRARDAADLLEHELSLELDNGRLFRLIAKLGFINERPGLDADRRWSETGDRYLLKLFRDYTFHQVYQDGRPAIDFGHVIETLNKLDAGVDEKIVLMSRDEQSMLVVSYRDLKNCFADAYSELLKPVAGLSNAAPGF